MPRRSWLAVAFLLLAAAPAWAAPPLYPSGSGVSGTRLGPDRSRAPVTPGLPGFQPAPRVPRRPAGVDAPAQVRQTVGAHYKAVVILVQFSDHAADTLNHTPAAFHDLLFSQGTHATGSLRDYYGEVSRGAFDIDGIVTRWYMAPRTYAEYANGQGGFGVAPFNAQQLALDVVRLADPDVDFAQFDNDGPDGLPDSGDDDGQIDGLFIVHAGPGGEETTSDNDIWSHKWNLPGGAAQVDGVSAFEYTTEPERWQLTTPHTTAGELISMGVFCHEFGHVLGLPDLYDTSGLPGANEGLGEWDLMASGLYNHRPGDPTGSSPAHLSAWSKWTLGWLEPTWVFQDTLSVTIPPIETTGVAYRLWTNGVDEGEYFLVENRQPIGFDAALLRSTLEPDTSAHAHGLVIYHVDPGVVGNDIAAHKMVDIEESGGIEQASGFTGVQNLDVERGSVQVQQACEGPVNVVGNRGDRYDAWPGLAARSVFDGSSCPNSVSYCGEISQVAIQNIDEPGSGPVRNVVADFLVSGTAVRRASIVVDDSPFDSNDNNGNGLVEPGETIRIFLPLRNLSSTPTGELTARVRVTEPYAGLLADSIYYGVIPGAAVDTGTVIVAEINATPDPRGVNLSYVVSGLAGVVLSDSVQILVGQRTGICETFESTQRRWVPIPIGCGGVNEWHREAGVNHTPGGAWAWRLGPAGLIGHYAPSQDARLVSQPIRLPGSGSGDTLTFWHRYDSEFAFDGMTVEVSSNAGATWSPLQPLGGYNTGDRFSGMQPAFTQVVVPLTGYSGLVQIAFRFRSQPPNEGLGWWIDDVVVNGSASCATTAITIAHFDATPTVGPSGPAVRLTWSVASGGIVGIDREAEGAERRRIATRSSNEEGTYLDEALAAGDYRYWLVASREGEPNAEAGPVLVRVASGTAPRRFALGPVLPNPIRSEATLGVSLDRDGPFMVRVFRADGRLVRTLARGSGEASDWSVRWDGRDDRGRPAGAGIYFFELRSGSRTRVQKAVLLR